MLAASGRISRGVGVPVTVDAEAGYGMEPAELVAALRDAGAAGCNLEDTDHTSGALRDPASHAAWLRAVREAASVLDYRLVINARVDVFLSALLAGSDTSQTELLPDGLQRAQSYLDAGVDCVFPIALWEVDALRAFTSDTPGPVNILKTPRAPAFGQLAELGVARVSYGSLLHRDAMTQFGGVLGSIAAESVA
jgi:2-methylisocitrate lyase-like PEP mutase family enzyme